MISWGLSDIRSQTGSKKSPILSRIPLPSSHENIYTIPNILTMTRLVAAPLVGYFLVHDYHQAALALFAYAGITDLVDGYIARRYNLQTVVGTIIDPMADKLLMTIGVACLAVNGSIPGKQLTDHYVGEIPTCTAMLTCSNSVARRHYSWSRCRPCYIRDLLSLDLTSPAQNHGTVLGFLSPFRRGQTHDDLQGQHRPAAATCGYCHCTACCPGSNHRRMESQRSNDRISVSGLSQLLSIIPFHLFLSFLCCKKIA